MILKQDLRWFSTTRITLAKLLATCHQGSCTVADYSEFWTLAADANWNGRPTVPVPLKSWLQIQATLCMDGLCGFWAFFLKGVGM